MPSRPTPTPPRIRELRLPDLSPDAGTEIHPHGSYEALAFTGDDLTGVDLSEAHFTDCSFTALNIHELELTGTRLTDSMLTRLDIPTALAAYASWRNVVLEHSRLGVLQNVEGAWDTVHVHGAKLKYLNLRGSTVRDVIFTDCVIEELDLTAAQVERMAFTDSKMSVLDVSGATLADVDLRALDLPDITGLAHLRGAAITHLQLQQLAPAMAEHLGLYVED
jgi:uncharacterized protein YjbI with pentapeptide repeats